MYLHSTPRVASIFFNSLTFNFKNSTGIHLSFDDGPHPESTPLLLEFLKENRISASFFCVGKQAERFPELISQIKDEGHTLGNHSYSHISGWKSGTKKYVEDVFKADQYINSVLFRPPYGRILPGQLKQLNKKFKCIMWTEMPGDFDPAMSEEKLKKQAQKPLKDGSIVVLHDKPECIKKTLFYLQALVDQGLRPVKWPEGNF